MRPVSNHSILKAASVLPPSIVALRHRRASRMVKKTDGPHYIAFARLESEIKRSFGRHGVAETGGTCRNQWGARCFDCSQRHGRHWLSRRSSSPQQSKQITSGCFSVVVPQQSAQSLAAYDFAGHLACLCPPGQSGDLSSPDDCAPHERSPDSGAVAPLLPLF